MFYGVIDKNANEYITSVRKGEISCTPYRYLAKYFFTANLAIKYLTRKGLGEELAKRFYITPLKDAPLNTKETPTKPQKPRLYGRNLTGEERFALMNDRRPRR